MGDGRPQFRCSHPPAALTTHCGVCCEAKGRRLDAALLKLEEARKVLQKVAQAVEHSSIAHCIEKRGADYFKSFDSTCYRCVVDKTLEDDYER